MRDCAGRDELAETLSDESGARRTVLSEGILGASKRTRDEVGASGANSHVLLSAKKESRDKCTIVRFASVCGVSGVGQAQRVCRGTSSVILSAA